VNQKILFVDDEPAALGLYRHMLKGEFEISTAVGGEDGIAMSAIMAPLRSSFPICKCRAWMECDS
jgi:hypothetical protein